LSPTDVVTLAAAAASISIAGLSIWLSLQHHWRTSAVLTSMKELLVELRTLSSTAWKHQASLIDQAWKLFMNQLGPNPDEVVQEIMEVFGPKLKELAQRDQEVAERVRTLEDLFKVALAEAARKTRSHGGLEAMAQMTEQFRQVSDSMERLAALRALDDYATKKASPDDSGGEVAS